MDTHGTGLRSHGPRPRPSRRNRSHDLPGVVQPQSEPTRDSRECRSQCRSRSRSRALGQQQQQQHRTAKSNHRVSGERSLCGDPLPSHQCVVVWVWDFPVSVCQAEPAERAVYAGDLGARFCNVWVFRGVWLVELVDGQAEGEEDP